MEETVFSFIGLAYVAMCFPRPYTIYIFRTPMARYSQFVLKVPLNTKQTNKQSSWVWWQSEYMQVGGSQIDEIKACLDGDSHLPSASILVIHDIASLS